MCLGRSWWRKSCYRTRRSRVVPLCGSSHVSPAERVCRTSFHSGGKGLSSCSAFFQPFSPPSLLFSLEWWGWSARPHCSSFGLQRKGSGKGKGGMKGEGWLREAERGGEMERREERLGQSWRGQGGSPVAQGPCPGSSGGGLLEAGGRGRKLPRERMGTVSLTKASMASVATSKTGLGLVAASCLRSTEVAHQLTSLPRATCYRSHLLSSTQPLLPDHHHQCIEEKTNRKDQWNGGKAAELGWPLNQE